MGHSNLGPCCHFGFNELPNCVQRTWAGDSPLYHLRGSGFDAYAKDFRMYLGAPDNMIMVEAPHNVAPGESFEVTTDNGLLNCFIPAAVSPGGKFWVSSDGNLALLPVPQSPLQKPFVTGWLMSRYVLNKEWLAHYHKYQRTVGCCQTGAYIMTDAILNGVHFFQMDEAKEIKREPVQMTAIAEMFAGNKYLGEGGIIWVALRDCNISMESACRWAAEAILQSVFRPRPRTDFWFPDLTFNRSSGAWNAVLGSGAHMVFQPLEEKRRRAGHSVLTRCAPAAQGALTRKPGSALIRRLRRI